MIANIDTIPNGLTMVARAEVYVDTAGAHYVAYTPSPEGVDAPKLCFVSPAPIELNLEDHDNVIYPGR